jgi:hypothetical protein
MICPEPIEVNSSPPISGSNCRSRRRSVLPAHGLLLSRSQVTDPNGQGGIMGGFLTALAPDWRHAVLEGAVDLGEGGTGRRGQRLGVGDREGRRRAGSGRHDRRRVRRAAVS